MSATRGLGVLWALWHIPLIGVSGGGFGDVPSEWSGMDCDRPDADQHRDACLLEHMPFQPHRLRPVVHDPARQLNAANRQFVLAPEVSLHGGDETRLLAIMTEPLRWCAVTPRACTGLLRRDLTVPLLKTGSQPLEEAVPSCRNSHAVFLSAVETR